MDNRPIGVFDSGLGGLTTVKKLEALMPREQIIYFGDTARVPYGGRSRETLIKYARQDVAFLKTFDLKAIVVACGTLSTTALNVIAAESEIPIFGVVTPASRAAVAATRNHRVGLIATAASIRTGAYERQMTTQDPGIRVFSRACPLFVPLVENGRFRPGDVVIETVVAEYLEAMKQVPVDTLVLGCTHYPLLMEIIGNYMGEDVTLIDSGAECARSVVKWLGVHDQLAGPEQTGGCQFYVSDSIEGFAQQASIFLEQEVSPEVYQIDIGVY
ncbi:MAG: glutamate racemase [Oscillospiraceae bacterium]|nr:glutamate racemase [Oscillospiraceae bacterium]